MFTKIVVPLDGSPLAAKALPYATALARTCGADLTLVRAVEPGPLVDFSPEIEQQARDAAKAYIETLRQSLIDPAVPNHLNPDKVRCRIAYGSRDSALLQAFAAENADLIVMTTHARGGLSRIILGSVASFIIRHSAIPVVTIRPESGTHFEAVDTLLAPPPMNDERNPVLVALDGTPEAEAILPSAIALAQKLAVPLSLLDVVVPFTTPPLALNIEYPAMNVDDEIELKRAAERYLRQVQVTIEAQGVQCSCNVAVGDVAEQILVYARAMEAQAIAMTTHARDPFSALVLGSVSGAVVHESHLPVLLMYTNGRRTSHAALHATTTPASHV